MNACIGFGAQPCIALMSKFTKSQYECVISAKGTKELGWERTRVLKIFTTRYSGETHLILGCKGASPFALGWRYNEWGLKENRGFYYCRSIW